MPVLAAWGFATSDGADRAVRGLSHQALHAQILLHDAAIVVWPEGVEAPKALRIRHPRVGGALGRGLWVLLLESIFGSQLRDPTRAGGPSSRILSGWSIGPEDVAAIRARVVAGTSALFIVCRVDTPDSLDQLERVLPGDPTRLCRTELSRPSVRRSPETASPATRPPTVVDVTAAEERAESTSPAERNG